jgi:hypothetical protein
MRSKLRHAIHPVEAALQYFRARAEVSGDKGHGGCGFEEAEGHYRAGAQRLRLSEIPQLAEQLRELSRLGPLDRAGRKAIAAWAGGSGFVLEEGRFNGFWDSQGRRGGAEHQVYYDPDLGRWFKRLFHCVNSSMLGDYLVRMRLHAVLFPETAYRLEGFTINSRNKEVAAVVSQPHVEVDTSRPPVTKPETDDLMAAMGFAPVQLMHNGVRDAATSPTSTQSLGCLSMICMMKTWFAFRKPMTLPSSIPVSPLPAKAPGQPSSWRKSAFPHRLTT